MGGDVVGCVFEIDEADLREFFERASDGFDVVFDAAI
jgi:hypothetical protein